MCNSMKLVYRRCHKKTYVSNYALFTLLHEWVDRGMIALLAMKSELQHRSFPNRCVCPRDPFMQYSEKRII